MPNFRTYTPLGLDGHELCHPIQQEDFELINIEVNGTSRRNNWTPIHVRLIHEDQGRKLIASDSPWLGAHALIFRASAVEALEPLLSAHGELLPLACTNAELFVYNATRVIDALDEDASSVIRFKDGRIMMIQRHVFRKEAVSGVDIFKIPNLRVSPTFVSDRFVELWKSAGLKGLEFSLT